MLTGFQLIAAIAPHEKAVKTRENKAMHELRLMLRVCVCVILQKIKNITRFCSLNAPRGFPL